MNRRIMRILGLCILATLLLVGLKQEARAQQGQDRGPEIEQLFNLTAYQGLEEMPYVGNAPAVDEVPQTNPNVDVPWSKIVFQSLRNLVDWNIYIADGNGSNQTQLTYDESADIHARLNHGGTRVVFASNRSKNYEIYTMNPDGTGVTRLTKNTKDDVYPAWSPDGNFIVFQSYRDGNPNIYVMNADGTNQTRLTTSKGYDGMPSWSPDGTRIAFASDQLGSGGIWVMNPDGSGLTWLALQQYSSYPSWSPDGSRIAFSAEADGDGWYELWAMDANGSDLSQIYDPPIHDDALSYSWSPDGVYIAFSEITYVYSNGNWYWTTAYLKALDTFQGAISNIIGDITELNPDWQTLDVLAPTSSLQDLPAISPASFPVFWSGYDNGPAGLKNWDIQVKDGEMGAWVDWKTGINQSSGTYTGLGGHIYYFRVRARDNHFNTEAWPASSNTFTTIETQPPTSELASPLMYMRNGGTIHWKGTDKGGSGIQSYDIQYRDLANNLWQDWLSGILHDQQIFYGLIGRTYDFRVRATDKAGNIGNWSSASDSTTLCYFALVGTVRENTDLPVSNANITVNPDGTTQQSSNGEYASCILTDSAVYSVTWDKEGYGELPSTAFSSQQDPSAQAILPALNNIIADWGFESGSLSADWVAGGDISPVITETARHTGVYGGMIGSHIEYGLPQTISQSVDRSYNPREIFDNYGKAYVLWHGAVVSPTVGTTHGLFFAQLDQNGVWSDPVKIWGKTYKGYSPDDFVPKLLMDDDNTLYVLWPENDPVSGNARILYARRFSDGTWSAVQPISGWFRSLSPTIDAVLSGDGYIHIVWDISSDREVSVYYAHCDLNGVWCVPRRIGDGYFNLEHHGLINKIGIDQNNEVSLIWEGYNNGTQVFYARRDVNGTWSNPVQISNQAQVAGEQLGIGPDGTVHVLWGEECCTSIIFYAQRNIDGTWSDPEAIPNVSSYSDAFMKNLLVTKDGTVYVFGFDYDAPAVRYVCKARDGAWSEPVKLDDQSGTYMIVRSDNQGGIYASWISNTGIDERYAQRKINGAWSPAKTLLTFPDFVYEPQFNVGPDGSIHLIWSDDYDGYTMHFVGPEIASQDYASSLSQSIVIPMTMTAPTLSFLYDLNGVSEASEASFNAQISTGSNSIRLLSSSENTEDWTHAWYNLTPWLGQTVTLTFSVDGKAGYPYAWAYLDEVTVGSANPDAWVRGFRSAGLPGEQVSFSIYYGNRGQAIASGGLITVTLPASLTFVSANIAPITTSITDTNVLVWDIGDLPANSGPFTLEITVALAADITLGSNLEIPVALSPTAMELELANNTSQVKIFVGRQLYLPVIVR